MFGIPELSSSNFSSSNEQILITLGCLNLDLALQVEKPLMSSNDNISNVKTIYEKLEYSNWISVMIIKSKIAKNIRGSTSTKAKEIFIFVEQQFVVWDKALTDIDV